MSVHLVLKHSAQTTLFQIAEKRLIERLGIGRGYLHVMLTFADSDREAADSYQRRQHFQLITWPNTDHCGVCIITHLYYPRNQV